MGTICLDPADRFETRQPHVFTRIRETWLSRRLAPHAAMTAAFSILALAIGSVLFWTGTWGADQWMASSASDVISKGQVWRLWTAIFAHADPAHFLSNSLLFFILGSLLAGHFGALMFPFAAFVLGGLVNAAALLTYPPETQLIGASGVVFLMGGTWLTLYVLLDRSRSAWQRTLRGIGVALMLFMPAGTFDPTVSYRTHAIGFAVGVAFALAYFFAEKDRFRAAEVVETIVEEDDLPSFVP